MTKAASVLSYLLIVLGVLRGGLGFAIAFYLTDTSAAERRYLGSASTGEAIDQGLMMIFVGITLGILVKIVSARKSN